MQGHGGWHQRVRAQPPSEPDHRPGERYHSATLDGATTANWGHAGSMSLLDEVMLLFY